MIKNYSQITTLANIGLQKSDAAPEHKGWLGRLGYLMGIMTIEPMMFVQVRSENIGHDDNDPDCTQRGDMKMPYPETKSQ